MQMNFQVGDKAVYPRRGVADVVGLETKTIGDQKIQCYHLQVVGSGLKIIVPVDKAAENGMRPVANDGDLEELYALLADHEVPCDRQTWNRWPAVGVDRKLSRGPAGPLCHSERSPSPHER